uniref:Uncharacterized protein n=1 Tax=Rhizophora mucronata TaxID=61149 RepID=A0A2P2R4T8_RHIMU
MYLDSLVHLFFLFGFLLTDWSALGLIFDF